MGILKKLRPIIESAGIAVFLVSCDEAPKTEVAPGPEDEVEPPVEVVAADLVTPLPKTHEEVIEEFVAWKEDFLSALTKVVDAPGAEEFLSGLPARKERMRNLLNEARRLPVPQPGVKSHYDTLNEDFSDKSSLRMDEFLERARAGPGARVIRELFNTLSEDQEAEELKQEFEALYR